MSNTNKEFIQFYQGPCKTATFIVWLAFIFTFLFASKNARTATFISVRDTMVIDLE